MMRRLTSKPFHPNSLFAWTSALHSSLDVIREEYLALRARKTPSDYDVKQGEHTVRRQQQQQQQQQQLLLLLLLLPAAAGVVGGAAVAAESHALPSLACVMVVVVSLFEQLHSGTWDWHSLVAKGVIQDSFIEWVPYDCCLCPHVVCVSVSVFDADIGVVRTPARCCSTCRAS
jgi:hypothetical protein